MMRTFVTTTQNLKNQAINLTEFLKIDFSHQRINLPSCPIMNLALNEAIDVVKFFFTAR